MLTNKLISIGIALLFIGIILIFAGSFASMFNPEKSKSSSIKSAGIIFIGPFPFGWASDRNMFYTLIVITLIFMIVYFIFFKFR